VQSQPRRTRFPSRPAGSSANVTAAVGMEETAGRVRARRSSLFTQTVIWVTGLICLALLLGTLAQAWSNSQLMRQVQAAQQQTQQMQAHHDYLAKLANHYQNPFVVETEAREKLGYIRPGEHPVVIVGSTTQTQQNAPQHTSQPAQKGFWQEWWNVFFGN
jgi:cell division protein FtsB